MATQVESRKSIWFARRAVGHALAVAIVSSVAACGGSETSSTDCSGEQIDDEAIEIGQNEQGSIGGRDYVVANLGPREVDGVLERGAQLLGGEVDVTFFDCEVVEIEGVEYRARIESTSVFFEPMAE